MSIRSEEFELNVVRLFSLQSIQSVDVTLTVGSSPDAWEIVYRMTRMKELLERNGDRYLLKPSTTFPGSSTKLYTVPLLCALRYTKSFKYSVGIHSELELGFTDTFCQFNDQMRTPVATARAELYIENGRYN